MYFFMWCIVVIPVRVRLPSSTKTSKRTSKQSMLLVTDNVGKWIIYNKPSIWGCFIPPIKTVMTWRCCRWQPGRLCRRIGPAQRLQVACQHCEELGVDLPWDITSSHRRCAVQVLHCAYTHPYILINIYIYVSLYYTYIYIYLHTRIHIYIYICTYIHIYTYTTIYNYTFCLYKDIHT